MAIRLEPKHNLAGAAVPGTSDDRSQDYSEGSRWINTQTGIEYVCIDATVGFARWQESQAYGLANVAGLKAALCGVAETPDRFALVERFEQRPLLATAIDPDNPNSPSQAEIDAIFAANRNFEVAGTNMTSALATFNVARGGVRLTTAGAENDQAILQPRTNPAGVSRWAAGFSSNLEPVLSRTFSVADWELVSFKAGLALTSAHNLTTDDDQVALWYDGAVTPEDEGPPVVPEFITEPNFRIAYSIAGTDAEIDIGIEPEDGKTYQLDILMDAARRAHVYLNGELVGRTPALAASKTLLPCLSIQTLEAAAKSIDVGPVGASMKRAA